MDDIRVGSREFVPVQVRVRASPAQNSMHGQGRPC